MSRVAAVLLLALALVALPSASAATVPRVSRIAVVVMENTEYGSVIGNSDAPFVNKLARRYGLSTRYYALAHPSLPNYLALLGGSTFGITDDCDDCSVNASNLIDQLDAAHIGWKAYMEGMPQPCFTGAHSGAYTKHHNPFVYFDDIATSSNRCAHVVPGSELTHDIAAGSLPRFMWITPDECHDMHDCSVATGDHYLAGLVPQLLHVLSNCGLVILTWDEGASDQGCCSLAAGGHVSTLLIGALVRHGARLARPEDHYSILRTIEDLWHLPRLREARCACTPSLLPLLKSG
jgi:hypothetical protein